MAQITGTFTVTSNVHYDSDALHKFVGRNPKKKPLTDNQLKDIADTLTANLESPSNEDGLTVDPTNEGLFNDSYYDMKEVLQDMYKV